LSDVLSDDAARSAGFGRDSVLNLPFPVAAKTGTSKGYRDNWAVGYTHEVTAAVWVGNFDGTPLRDASGITAAGPAFHELMLAAMRGRTPAPLYEPGHLSAVEVCTLSGQLPGHACPHRRLEHFARGHEPRETCDMHVLANVDGQGRETAARCATATRTLERYPLEFREWAQLAGRPLAGANVSESCPPEAAAADAPHVTFPRDAQTFAIDPDGPSRQEIVLSAAARARSVRFIVDGHPTAELPAPFRQPWRLTPGTHTLQVEAAALRSPAITFNVTAP
jgi:penicillin-binding protein 1C